MSLFALNLNISLSIVDGNVYRLGPNYFHWTLHSSFTEIAVVCEPDYIEVTLMTADYPGIIVNDSLLHLADASCVAGYKDDDMIKFTFGLEACGTEQSSDEKRILYNNKIYLTADEASDDDAITRKHMQIIPFQCGYDKTYTISKVSYSPRTTMIITDAGNVWSLWIHITDVSSRHKISEKTYKNKRE